MKKKVVSILTAVTLCAAMLAGCGGGNDEAAATETTETTETADAAETEEAGFPYTPVRMAPEQEARS